MDYKWVGTHTQDLASGRMLEPGEVVLDLSEEDANDPHNKALIESGLLMSLEEQAGPNATENAVDLARESGINLAEVQGTGASGRITKEDVERHLADQNGGDR